MDHFWAEIEDETWQPPIMDDLAIILKVWFLHFVRDRDFSITPPYLLGFYIYIHLYTYVHTYSYSYIHVPVHVHERRHGHGVAFSGEQMGGEKGGERQSRHSLISKELLRVHLVQV